MSRITHYLDATGHGGDASVALLLAASQVEVGHEVSLLIGWSEHSGEFVERCRDVGVTASVIPGVRHDRAGESKRHRITAIARSVRQTRCDVLHVHVGGLGVFATDAVASRCSGARRRVVTVHGPLTWADYPDDRFRRVWARLSMLFHAVTVPSQAALVHQQEAGVADRRLRVMPNPVPPHRIAAERESIRAELGIAPTDTMLLFLGRVEESKGVLDVIAAMRTLIRRHAGVRLVVAGTGSVEDRLVEAAASTALGSALLLVGHRSDTQELLAAADVFVHPSHAESFGMSVVEAMAAGSAVVTTPVGVAADFASDDPPVSLVEIGDVDALVSAISGLILDPQRRERLGALAQQVAAQYSPAAIVALVDGVYAVTN